MKPLEIRHIHVRPGALDLEVAASLDSLYVTAEQADCILGVLPNLAHHVCVNGKGDGTFGEELVGTELPHLLEHVIIELQGQTMGSAGKFTGHTSWLAERSATAPQGYALMRVTVSFMDDLVALRAMNEAIAIIEQAVLSGRGG